jgi:TIGR00730 family protein
VKRIAVFCGSSRGANAIYAETAVKLGRSLVDRGIRLVYGGGQIGLMGVVADAVLAAGGEVIGVIPEALALKEVAHEGLTEMRVVASMHERKAMMADLSDAFIAMPGGFGTFEEFCEIITWAQLGLHTKPCGLLNVNGYYDPLLALFDHGVRKGFIRQQHRALVLDDPNPDALLKQILAWSPSDVVPIVKWLERDEI